MKIAVIAPSHIPARRANTVQVMKMSAALIERGHTLQVYAPEQPALGEAVSPAELRRHYGLSVDVPVQWVPVHPRLRRYDYGMHSANLARQWGAGVVYTRLPQAAGLCSARRVPTIYEVHDLPYGRAGQFLFRLFLRSAGARRLVVISLALLQDLEELFGTALKSPFTLVAPDGVDLQRYTNLPDPPAARQQLGLPPGFTAGYTGHLYPGRGAELLLALARRLPHVQFLLVGGEPGDVARVQSQATGLGNVTLTGFVPNAELPLYQAACDALLMPYAQKVEASSGGDIARYLSPMKLFEYLACGRVILSSNLPVLGEVLNPANAVLLHPSNETAWADALHSLQADPAPGLRLAEQARRDAQRYTWEERARQMLEGLE